MQISIIQIISICHKYDLRHKLRIQCIPQENKELREFHNPNFEVVI